jgi:hypothetical protein
VEPDTARHAAAQTFSGRLTVAESGVNLNL